MEVKTLGCVDYASSLEAMRAFTASRTPETHDELWLCEHAPVFTQGLAGRAEHVRDVGGAALPDIPIVHSNRGGQVTYHGPGQVVAYPLVDLKRLGIYVKEYVYRLEQAVIKTLESYDITGHRVRGAPGIYVRWQAPGDHASLPVRSSGSDPFEGLGKVAALGIKVSQQRAYHGLALNVAMDLTPFSRINPCGYPGLRTVDLRSLGVHTDVPTAGHRLAQHLSAYLTL